MKFLILSAVFLLNFISYKIAGQVFMADVALITLSGISLLYYKEIKVNMSSFLLLVFIFYSFCVFVVRRDDYYFQTASFISSFSKFIFYSFSWLVVPSLLEKNKKECFRIIQVSLRVVCVLGLFQFIAHHLPFDIPYSLSINGYGYSSMTSYSIFRIRSIYSEPSLFLFSVVQYFFLITSGYEMRKRDHLLFSTAIILTFSLTVYGLLSAGLVLYFWKRIKSPFQSTGITVLILITLIFLYHRVGIISTHVENLITLKPSSSTTRIFGSLIYAYLAPPTGVGFGNLENYYQSQFTQHIELLITGGVVNNIFAAIKIISGYIGLLLFILLLVKSYSKSNIVFLTIVILSCFAWGNFNSSGFFTFLILLEVQKKWLSHRSTQLQTSHTF